MCEQPVQVAPDLRIPRCLDLITPADVIRRIEWYFLGGAMTNGRSAVAPAAGILQPVAPPATAPTTTVNTPVLLEFRHGLGDAVQLTAVLRHLREFRPSWDVDVASLPGKHSAFSGLCRQSLILDQDVIDAERYARRFKLDWHESQDASDQWPSTKVTRCLREVFGLTPQAALCGYEIAISPAARQLRTSILTGICGAAADATGRFPAVLIHYEGNTSAEQESLARGRPRNLRRDSAARV